MYLINKMKLTIFARLSIGFLIILSLAMTVSINAILHLRKLEKITNSIFTIDNQLIDYCQNLSDTLLTMIMYEKKYLIIKDESLHDQFIQTKGEFLNQYKMISSISYSDQIGNLLLSVNQHYRRYESLFDEEVKYIKSVQQYPEDTYKQDKDREVNMIMENLMEIKSSSQQDMFSKVKSLGKSEVNASNAAIVIGLSSLIFGIMISIFLTVNITSPLSAIKNKTKEIAEGNFGAKLDISSPPEIKELANAFNIMCLRLQELDKLKSDFFSTMSHELRTPLTTIKEGTSLLFESLNEADTTANQNKLLTIINEECNRLINLVNSLLDLSKMDAGMMKYNFIKTKISPLIGKVTREIEPLAETKKITIETTLNKELPDLKIDSDRILHVLRNLIGNALKFTEFGGKVHITAIGVEHGVKISVSDTGRGIAINNVNAIFEKYYQAHSGRTKGTGLGLFIVKNIIEAHGGKVWVENSTEHGSTFSFVLPV